jgi:hypothetical protein
MHMSYIAAEMECVLVSFVIALEEAPLDACAYASLACRIARERPEELSVSASSSAAAPASPVLAAVSRAMGYFARGDVSSPEQLMALFGYEHGQKRTIGGKMHEQQRKRQCTQQYGIAEESKG